MNDALPKKGRFQFGISHLLVAMFVVAMLFSLAHYIGVVAAVFVAVNIVVSILLSAAWARQSSCADNLSQIVLALHKYHDTFGSLPPAYVADKNGRPMHSWRVLILPFLEQQDIYQRYRFDEPWDGPNNSQLAALDLPFFRCPSDTPSAPGETNYLAVVGPETAWPRDCRVRLSNIADRPLYTILVVETRQSGIRWSEPRDLDMLQMPPTINARAGQGISSRHPRGANVAFADCAVRFLSYNLQPDRIRYMLTIRAG